MRISMRISLESPSVTSTTRIPSDLVDEARAGEQREEGGPKLITLI